MTSGVTTEAEDRASSARSRRRFSTRAGSRPATRSTRSSSTSTRLQNCNRRDDLRAESLPRFPSVVRDLSVLVDSTLPAAAVRGTIRSAAPAALAHVIEFDRYRGKGVPEGRVSLSLRLTFRSPERTLTDAEVDEAMTRIVDALASTHGAVRR